MGAARYIKLSEGEDEVLRCLAQGQGIHHKVRLRANILRLSAQGWSVPRLSKHFMRSQKSVLNDLERWEGQGVEGIADQCAPGNSSVFTDEMVAYLQKSLGEEQAWDCSQLSDALFEEFGLRVGREAIRVRLLTLGYSWQRSRYEPGKEADPLEVEKAGANIETLKRGHWTST